MVPVRLARGEGRCGLSLDRGWDQRDELIQNVPVLTVRSPDGALKVVVMSYASHPTSLKAGGGVWKHGDYAPLLQKWSPDFPGFAVAGVESKHAGAMAMFVQGCGGDRASPQRGRLEKTKELGALLAAAVEEVLDRPMQNVEPKLRTAFRFVELRYGETPSREFLESQLAHRGGHQYLARWAARLLKRIEAGEEFPRSYAEFPVSVWKLGEDHFQVSLGGETTSGYSINIRRNIAPGAMVLGFTNDVMAYIPTPGIIRQGGYIGQSSMAVYGVPAMRWSDDIENKILAAVREMVSELNE
jgi:hypothetical protein